MGECVAAVMTSKMEVSFAAAPVDKSALLSCGQGWQAQSGQVKPPPETVYDYDPTLRAAAEARAAQAEEEWAQAQEYPMTRDESTENLETITERLQERLQTSRTSDEWLMEWRRHWGLPD